MSTSPLVDAMVHLNVDDTQHVADEPSSAAAPRNRRHNKPRGPPPVRDPDQEARKIYVGNLPFSTNEEELEAHFTDIGPIESVVIARRFHQRSSGFGFIVFENEQDVVTAVAQKHNTKIVDREIVVENTIHRDEAKPRTRKPRMSKHEDQEDDVVDPEHKKTGSRRKPRRHHEDQENDDGTKAAPRYARRSAPRKKPMSETGTELPTTVYVRGLRNGVTSDDLQKLFESNAMAPVHIEIRVPRYTHRAFALVEFADASARNCALECSLELSGRQLTLQPAFAPAPREPKDHEFDSNDGAVEANHTKDNIAGHLSDSNAEAAKAE